MVAEITFIYGFSFAFGTLFIISSGLFDLEFDVFGVPLFLAVSLFSFIFGLLGLFAEIELWTNINISLVISFVTSFILGYFTKDSGLRVEADYIGLEAKISFKITPEKRGQIKVINPNGRVEYLQALPSKKTQESEFRKGQIVTIEHIEGTKAYISARKDLQIELLNKPVTENKRFLGLRSSFFRSTAKKKCYHCGKNFGVGTKCSQCEKKPPKCPVCKMVIYGKEKNLVKCPKCETTSHKNHLLEWLKIKKKCPVCQEQITTASLIKAK
jgi:membrane protein implicated in regulation of membrane protease activity